MEKPTNIEPTVVPGLLVIDPVVYYTAENIN